MPHTGISTTSSSCREDVFGEARPLVADHQGRAAGEFVVVQVPRIGRLLEADEPVAGVAQFVEHRGERAMGFDRDGVGPVAGDLAIELRRPGANDPLDATAAGRPGDPREIDVAPHRGAHEHQLPRPLERRGRFVALVFEIGHKKYAGQAPPLNV